MFEQRSGRLGYSRADIVLAVLVVGMTFGLLMIAIASLKPRRHDPTDPQTRNFLKYIALACHSYHDVFKRLPPAFGKVGDMQFAASVHVHLLPYVEQDNLFRVMYSTKGDEGRNAIVPPYLAMSDPSPQDNRGVQNFAANLRVFSDKGLGTSWDENMRRLARVEPGNAVLPATFSDGVEATILFATKMGVCGAGGSHFAAAPDSPFAAFFGQNAAAAEAHSSEPGATFQLLPSLAECRASPLTAQSFHEKGISVAFADGSTRFISRNIDPRTWNLLLQPNDGMTRPDWDD